MFGTEQEANNQQKAIHVMNIFIDLKQLHFNVYYWDTRTYINSIERISNAVDDYHNHVVIPSIFDFRLFMYLG